MVHHNKQSEKKRGFTLVELIVVLAIMAIMAALVGGGLIAYIRLARFEKNESNARTLFQAAQISLTRMDTAGELDAFRDEVTKNGSTGQHFAEGLTDADGNPIDGRTQKDLNTYIAALYYDKTGAAAGNHNALVEQLLGDYIYDDSLLNASICVEIDIQSGQVYSVFYDTNSSKLRFNEAGATNIYDRSYTHRRHDSLVGYYSAEDRVNVVQLQQTKLKIKNPRLTNGETLTLSWSGNSNLSDLDTSYTATAYAKEDTARKKPLFAITIRRDNTTDSDAGKQVITKMNTVIYHYDAAGNRTEEAQELCFPLSYNRGSFVLTLDAMADATLLRAAENDEQMAKDSLFSITRLLDAPQDIYIVMRAEPRENYSDTYTASSEVQTPTSENTLLATGGNADQADLKYFRHLYNLRWAADWDITGTAEYTLKRQSANSTGLNWTGGGVTVYCADGAGGPVARVPSMDDAVAWPTIPELGSNIRLTSEQTLTGNTRVPIVNLQLRGSSVANVGRKGRDELCDRYVGLIGENKGEINHITLRDTDIQVNVETVTAAANAQTADDELKLTDTKWVRALDKDTDEDWRDVHAVGALCGVNTGTLKKCALTRGTNAAADSVVAAALSFDSKTKEAQRVEKTLTAGTKTYTYYENEPRGIGGLVGFAVPETDAVMQDLTVDKDVTVAGLLVDEDPVTGTGTPTDPAELQKTEKARYAAAALDAADKDSLWRAVGTGGVFGVLDAADMDTDDNTNIINNALVTGNGFVGGIAGNLYNTGAKGETLSLTGLTNNGTISAGANYKGDAKGSHSAVLGQFFGGIAGYGKEVTLRACRSATRSDLTETRLKEQIYAGFDMTTGALTDASPLKGDFVGGLVGYGKDLVLDTCTTAKGYVLGNRFVGGLAGGFTGSSMHENGTNSSDVFGNRYVGGIVSVNGSNSHIRGMANTGLAAAFGHNAAYVGGIVGVNDATWGRNAAANTEATIVNCANRMSGDNATDTRRINLLKELSSYAGKTEYANYVGGIAGYNGVNGTVTWDKNGTPSLGAILYGNNYVGGVAGYNDAKATISNDSTQKLTIRGQIVAAGKAVGGMIGLNCAPALPSVTVAATRIEGEQIVGGVIGANLPVGGFAVNGSLNTNVASGRVSADAIAGGIIGYNRLLAAMPQNVDLAALLPEIDPDTGRMQDSTAAVTQTDVEIVLDNFKNKLNLNANVYVGGILGYNDAETKLTIRGAVNGDTHNSLSVGGLNLNTEKTGYSAGVPLDGLAGNRYSFGGEHGYLAGGIIGYASANTKLDSCTNYGTVAHRAAAGGLAGWNEGTISGGTMAASLGSRQDDNRYLGGIAGVNANAINDAYPDAGCAVRGGWYIGGVAGANIGSGVIACTTESPAASVEANNYAGGVAGANAATIAVPGGQLHSSVTATAYAGGVAGANVSTAAYAGTIRGADGKNGMVWGQVTASQYAGGIVGRNGKAENEASISNRKTAAVRWMENKASVRVSNSYAGGIAGVNNEGGLIQNSRHTATTYTDAVYATNGEAGGIAGRNNAGANIENVQVSAAVTAANGAAGGITASNYGTIGAETAEAEGSVANCTITGTSSSIGAVAVYNQKGGIIRNLKLAENAGVRFNTPATAIGGIAGRNLGSITGCTVQNGSLALGSGLRAGTNAITLGGAVGSNGYDAQVENGTPVITCGTVSNTAVELDITENLDKYVNLGGIAGQNDGTLDTCTYRGTLGGQPNAQGLVSVGATSTGSAVGGIAGTNALNVFGYTDADGNKKSVSIPAAVTGCEVKNIMLQVSGISNITTTQTADEKLNSASHVGGIVGRNAAQITNSYVGTERRADGSGSIITARYGFVGGVAGSNNGTITGSGSKTVQEKLMPSLKNWIEKGNTNDIVAALRGNPKNITGATGGITGTTYVSEYADLKGVDTVSVSDYTNVYNATGLGSNDLLVGLRGSNYDMANVAAGHLGGITGFNSLNGSIRNSATGKWFIYADNAPRTETTVGGIVGQNESNVTDENVLDTVVNCAAVRRFGRHTYNSSNKTYLTQQQANDSDKTNYYDSGNRFEVQVGGIICNQNNRSGDRWSIANCINFGTVYNSRANNLGGVISLWTNYGGTLQNCYNFGDLMTNFNDGGDDCGTMGGIVGYYDAPIANTAVNILSCQNHGSMYSSINKWSSANDIGGIFGKVQMKNASDIMTINLYDCVNGSTVKIEARSMIAGIFAYLAPWNGVYNPNVDKDSQQYRTVPYVTINIDRCRSYTINMSTTRNIRSDNDGKNRFKLWVAGIVGSRSEGGYSVAATTITNCFAIVRDNWHPIAYDKRPSTQLQLKDGSQVYGEHIEGHNNYYIDVGTGDADVQSTADDVRAGILPKTHINSYKNVATTQPSHSGVDARTLQETAITTHHVNWNALTDFSAESDENKESGGRRLFIGINKADSTTPYFAMLPTATEDGKNAAYDITQLNANNAYIQKKTDENGTTRSYVTDADGNVKGQLLLFYSEGPSVYGNSANLPDNEDITDEVIQAYYKNLLDNTKPAKPENIQVKASQVQDADNNVYGRYEVTWDEPSDKTASPAAYYHVEVLPCNATGGIDAGAVPYVEADVYERGYTFVADKAWTGNFIVRVTPHNTNNNPDLADNSGTSTVQTFMHALPTPEIEFRLVKRDNGGFDWNQCEVPDQSWNKFVYEQVAVLKNYDDYPTDENWTVTLKNDRNTYTFSREKGKCYIRLTQRLERTVTYTALATPDSTSTQYLRSAQYQAETYIPSQWRDNNSPNQDKSEDGLPLGTLAQADKDTPYVTYSGQTAESFTAKVAFSFTPQTKSDSPSHGNPTYRVMLLAKYLGDDEVNGQSQYGQYITLAARESIVTTSPVTFNLNGLPSDAMSNYTDFLVIAVPITSGKGDVTTRWEATADEVANAIASHAKETNDANKEIWWQNGYEIVRTGDHSYSYAHLTPLCFSDESRSSTPGWATQATVTTPQIIFKQLNLNVLPAPALADTIDEGKVDKNNELTYTFKWTQDDLKDGETPDYSIKLYGVLDDTGDSKEEITLKDGITLTPVQNGKEFTLNVNVDTMLANGSDSWRYNTVQLEVSRVPQQGTTEIGASAAKNYAVKTRLPSISAPGTITRVNGKTDNADDLCYIVGWSASSDANIDHYDLCMVDADGNTVLTLPTTGNVNSMEIDLEQYQGMELRFRVIARKKADADCFDGPNGALSRSETIVTRADAPAVTGSDFEQKTPDQETFLTDLKLNMTLEKEAEGNIYFTGYIFANPEDYETIRAKIQTWQNAADKQEKYSAQQALTAALTDMVDSGAAQRVIPYDNRNVGESASASGKAASYTFVPDGNGFTMTPDHAKQYLLPAVRVMPTDGSKEGSNWYYILQDDVTNAQLPAITLDTPVDADEPQRALGTAVITQNADLYADEGGTRGMGSADLALRRFTIEWTAANKYTAADGAVRNLTDRYAFEVTPEDGQGDPYTVQVTTYAADVTDADGTLHPRGEILRVEKTLNGQTCELLPQTITDEETGETRVWYDLSPEPTEFDADGNAIVWASQPKELRGTVEKDDAVLYYKTSVVPMLELVQESGAEPVYRITLPELQSKLRDDDLALQKFTASVTLQTLAHSDDIDRGDNAKTVQSETVPVIVNEDAQTQEQPAEEPVAVEAAPEEAFAVPVETPAPQPTPQPATPETADDRQ